MDEMKDKTQLQHAIEMMLRNADEIKVEALRFRSKLRLKHQSTKSDAEIRKLAAKDIIEYFSNKTAISGGATALTGIIPGLGTVVAALGGTMADAALSLKYDVEMMMALGVLYDYDIETEAGREMAMALAGLGVIVNFEGKSAQEYIKLVSSTLSRNQTVLIAQVFKHVSTLLAKKALGKAIPLGIGVVLSASANKKMSYSLGKNALAYFEEKSQPAENQD